MTAKQYFKGINVVLDTLWGDSGKGKIVDLGAQHVDMVIRYAGGSNAGHTIKNDKGEFKLHLIPSGIFNNKVLNIIDSGVVVNPQSIVEEFLDLKKQGVKITNKNLLISRRAHLVMPWHLLRDQPKKSKSTSGKIDTTGRGIGPAYSDRTAREGLRVKDLFSANYKKLVTDECHKQNVVLTKLYSVKALNPQTALKSVQKFRTIFKPFIVNTFPVIQEYKRKRKIILGEGAQGALLDIELGGFPFVTSSHPTVAGFSISTGIQDHEIQNVIGVTKAYSTCVGARQMPTELLDKTGEALREIGGEYGATTGRPRRCGWIDLPATRYGILVSGARTIALTKLDVLDSFSKIKVCTGYKIKNKIISIPPDVDSDLLENVTPIYRSFPGWKKDTTAVKKYKDLPVNAKKYVKFLEEQLGLPIIMISVGASRKQTIFC